jgi:hypothetical protein
VQASHCNPLTRTRENRTDLRPLARPQSGVDDLKGKFGRPTRDIPGVADIMAGPALR